jgi:hypothetical protein
MNSPPTQAESSRRRGTNRCKLGQGVRMGRLAIWLALLLCVAVLLVVPVGCGGDDDGNGGGGGVNGETTEMPEETTEG